MSLATIYLILGGAGLTFSVLTFFRIRLFAQLTIPTFFIGWLRGELALQTIAIEAIATFFFWRAGVLETGVGQLAFVFCCVSWMLLGITAQRGMKAGREILEACLGGPLKRRPERDSGSITRRKRTFAT